MHHIVRDCENRNVAVLGKHSKEGCSVRRVVKLVHCGAAECQPDQHLHVQLNRWPACLLKRLSTLGIEGMVIGAALAYTPPIMKTPRICQDHQLRAKMLAIING